MSGRQLAGNGWRHVLPAGTVEVRVPAGRDARALAGLRALPAGTPVALLGGYPLSRWRLRRAARRHGVELDREYLALPTLRSPVYVVEDTPEAVSWVCRDLLSVPPGVAVLALPVQLALTVARRRVNWVRRLAPARVAVGCCR